MSKLFVLCVFHKYCSSNNGRVSYFLDTFKRHFWRWFSYRYQPARTSTFLDLQLPSLYCLKKSAKFIWILGWRDKLSSKKLSLYFKQRCVLWILGLPGKKVNFRLSLSKLQKSRCLPQNGAVQPACLTASFIFFFWLLFFCLVLFLLFSIGQKCAALLFRTKIVSIVYFDHERKNLRSELS